MYKRQFAEQRVNRRIGRAQAREFCAVEKTGMVGDELVELREFGNDVIGAVPIQAGAAVDFYFFRGEPFNAAGKAESAAWSGERTKTISQERPHAAFFGEAVVVVGFAVMNVTADAFALVVRIIKIPGDIGTGIILEKFRVSPLHSAIGEQVFRGFPRTAEAFEQKNYFGKFILHAGDDVLPRGHGDFVASIAAKTIHAAMTPGQQRISDGVPKFHVALFQFNQILPDRAPQMCIRDRLDTVKMFAADAKAAGFSL